MRLNLREIIEVPGASLPFQCELDTQGLDFPSVQEYKSRPKAQGRVFNEAGVLHMEGTLRAEMSCVCDRCGCLFDSVKLTQLDARIKIHDFRMVPGPTHTNLIFDALVPAELKLSDRALEEQIENLVHNTWKKYFAVVDIDRSYV